MLVVVIVLAVLLALAVLVLNPASYVAGIREGARRARRANRSTTNRFRPIRPGEVARPTRDAASAPAGFGQVNDGAGNPVDPGSWSPESSAVGDAVRSAYSNVRPL